MTLAKLPREDADGERWYTVAELAEVMRVGKTKVRELINEGRIGYTNVGGGTRNEPRIPHSEYLRFMKDRTVPARISA